MIRKFYLAAALTFFGVTLGFGVEPTFPDLKVLPWNGYKAATSLTFDDSDPSHLDVAVPELNQRKMKGTFYLIANRTDRKDDWRKLLTAGHELGNHTLDHKHTNELTPKDEEAQVVGAQNVLQKEFGVPVLTFAYPFTEISPGLTKWLTKTHLLARGGYGNGNYVNKPDVEPDWLNISARATMTDLKFEAYKSWIDEDVAGGGWLVWMIHGLEGTQWGWQPIQKKVFTQILDYLQKQDIWVGTFLEVGSYFRAQREFEKVVPQVNGKNKSWNWKVPNVFPAKVQIKVKLVSGQNDSKGFEIWQGKQKITPDEKGLFSISFDQKELSLKPAAVSNAGSVK